MELGRICWDFLYLLLPKMYNFIKKDYHEAAHGSSLHASCIPSNNCSVCDTAFHWQQFLSCHLWADRTLLKHYLSLVQSNSTHNLVVSVYLIILLAITTDTNSKFCEMEKTRNINHLTKAARFIVSTSTIAEKSLTGLSLFLTTREWEKEWLHTEELRHLTEASRGT